MPASSVRTRFAPSPSGHLHVGGARTALFCWAYARGRDGRFILRIEDTDRKRCSDAATHAFFEDLKWLGIGWDEGPEFDGWGGGEAGPYYQSQRLAHYHAAVGRLLDAGRAYRAFETPEQLAEARRAAEAAGGGYRYDRAALGLDAATVQRHLDEGRPHVVRFRVHDEGEVAIPDAVRGETTVVVSELDDFVILKADGYPTYHFAVVLDDAAMEVTHVIRGQEHLYNTARHLLLQDALGLPRPVYAHVSTITNPDGSKMSKRDKDKMLRKAVKERGLERPPPGPGAPAVPEEHWHWWLESKDRQLETDAAERLAAALGVQLPEIDVEDFRAAGYLPEVMVNYLALLGWSPAQGREKFDAEYFVKHFELDRVIRSPAKFDRDKLLAFNLDALQATSGVEFRDRLLDHGLRYHPEFVRALGEQRFSLFAACNHARSKTLDDAYRSCRFLVIADDEIVYETSKPVRKALESGDPNGYAHLERLVPVLESLPEWDVETLTAALEQYSGEYAGGKLGKVAQPLRVAVTGGVVSPAIHETLALLGRESTVSRIRRCLARREAPSRT